MCTSKAHSIDLVCVIFDSFSRRSLKSPSKNTILELPMKNADDEQMDYDNHFAVLSMDVLKLEIMMQLSYCCKLKNKGQRSVSSWGTLFKSLPRPSVAHSL